MNCFSCKFLAKKNNPLIYSSNYWVVDHAYRSKLVGWLVIILKRHAEALHELTDNEFQELNGLIKKSTRVLHKELRTQKEYVAFFAEGEGFHHVHIHIIPRSKNLPEYFKGPKIFSMLKPTSDKEIPREEIKKMTSLFRRIFNKR